MGKSFVRRKEGEIGGKKWENQRENRVRNGRGGQNLGKIGKEWGKKGCAAAALLL